MTGSNIEFGHAEGALKTIADRVVEAKAEFQQHSNTLDGQIAALKGKWEGDGGRAFMILHQAWTEKHKVVTTALDKFHASLTETERDNVAVDQAAGGEMNKLINKLGSL
ncbi:WXG100 family type VII secretion target [Nocardioides sp. SYSU DS0651]|uniref:WXG100 family type VII secretion target n=1 Tax=Nocardioides sp. SYSU DS0651 TaxID=3415955 RepID=UPI003F4B9AE3